MPLTPVSARGFRRVHAASRHLVVSVATMFVMACTRTTPGPATVPPAQPVVSPPAILPQASPTRSRLIAPDSAVYDVTSIVIGSDLDVPSAPRDSAVYRELITSTLTIGRDSSITVTAQSDSGYQLPRGRDVPPEIAARSKTAYRASVQRELPSQRMRNATVAADCSPGATLVSPVMPLLALQFAMQITREPRFGRDSLSYTTCQTGLLIRHTLHIAPDSGLTAIISRSTAGARGYVISGTIAADSSRALPMRMTGQISGSAELSSRNGVGILPAELRIKLQTDLSFQSSTRTQRLQQSSTTTFVARD